MIDATHSPERRSWVVSANQHADFPIQNLPLGVFAPPGGAARGGVAIGDDILDLAAALELGLFAGLAAPAAQAAAGATLNPLLALGREARVALRHRPLEDSRCDGEDRDRSRVCAPGSSTAPPIAASTCRPRSATTPTSLPASTTPPTPAGCSGPTIRCCRTTNTCRSAITAAPPRSRHPARRCVVRAASESPRTKRSRPSGRAATSTTSSSSASGSDRAMRSARPSRSPRPREHVAGFCLLNDWSARDIQAWEYQPLGPFLGKSFLTTISPWVVTPEALAPFRVAQAPRPRAIRRRCPICSMRRPGTGALDIELEVLLLTRGLRGERAAAASPFRSATRDLYWTVAQLVAHHSSNGCNLRPGDLFGTGTISGPTKARLGSLLEISAGRPRADYAASGETAPLPRGRRHDHHARRTAAATVSPHRLRRMPRDYQHGLRASHLACSGADTNAIVHADDCSGELVMTLTKTAICDFGWKARDFALKGVDGKTYRLADVRGPKGTLVTFICNHCPYVKSSIGRLVDEANALKDDRARHHRHHAERSDRLSRGFVRQHEGVRQEARLPLPLRDRRDPGRGADIWRACARPTSSASTQRRVAISRPAR